MQVAVSLGFLPFIAARIRLECRHRSGGDMLERALQILNGA